MKLEFLFIADLKKGTYVEAHTHPALELVYYFEGKGSSRVGNKTVSTCKGHLAINPAGQAHDQRVDADIKVACIGLTGSGLEQAGGVYPDRDGLLKEPCRRLVQESQQNKPFTLKIQRGLLLEIVGLAGRLAYGNVEKVTGKGTVLHALELIDDMDGRLSVQHLSQQLFVSADHLRHLFRLHSVHSPIRQIINTRMDKARELLRDSALPVKRVAEECGFENEYHFSRLFKKTFDVPPSVYRRTKRD
jgi:AraC family transcriptional activator of pobA